MGNFISFRPGDAKLPGYVRFVLTKGAYRQMTELCSNAENMLARFSQSRTLIGLRGKEADLIKINTPVGTFNCRRNESGLLVTGFYKNTLMDQNNAMKYGVCFEVTDGIIVQLRLTAPYEKYYDLVNGRQDALKLYEQTPCTAATRLMLEKVAQSDEHAAAEPVPTQEPEEDEEYTPEWQLEELLDVAERYANLSSDLEKQKANDLGKILYDGISAAEYDRVDRVAYRFGVRGLDETVFKPGVQVALEDKNGQTQTAEILALSKADEDAPVTALTLLFNGQVSIDSFHSTGFFSLSFSTVNRDVQMDAIDKIRDGKAKSVYMDAVLGRNEPAGFDSKDLTDVEQELLSQDRPPNPAQLQAIRAGINTRDVLLVMGPPGTGKTTVIQEWVRYFVTREHKRVLVSSQNNKAVDNVLARLAEEKDIDVIRIGTESKLQSDVLPYMFENKVAALRGLIQDGTSAHERTVDALVRDWQAYALRLDEAAVVASDLQRVQATFRQAVQQQLLPLYQHLQSQLREQNQLGERMRKLASQMRKLTLKLRRHETATNFLIRFFTGIFYRYRLQKLRRLPEKLEELRYEEQALIKAYSANYERYRLEQEQVKNFQYLALVQIRGKLDSAMEALNRKPPRDPETDIWDLFGPSRSILLRSAADFPAQKEQLRKDTARAASLKQVLGAWREDMAGKQNYALGEIVLDSVDLVGATCIGINSQRRFANLDFDVTIIDEAGQIQIHNALVPMSVSGKVIMLGDHKQIPPSADGNLVKLCREQNPPVDTELLYRSLFEKMYFDLPERNKIMLDTQYRMPAQIADTISEWFYEGRYYSPAFKQNIPGMIPGLSASPFVIIDTSEQADRHESAAEGGGCVNELEARIVQTLIRHIAGDERANLKEVGVISAYKAQVKLIKNKLNTFLLKTLVSEMVATLDSYQGQERDIILYSFSKSSTLSPHSRRIGFLNELRRLNVAMTRCKQTLVLIGDMRFLSGCLHCEQDAWGNEIYERSEKQFSDFIKKMLNDVRGGRGEILSYAQFMQKMEGGES